MGFLLAVALAFLALLAVNFLIGRFIPIDPVLSVVGDRASNEVFEAARVAMGHNRPGIMHADRLEFDGIDLLGHSERQMRRLRGARLSMVMQDLKFSLHPVMRVGDQIAEALRCHERLRRRDVKARVIDMLDKARINDPEAVARL